MSTVTLRDDATDDLERRLAGIGAAAPGRSGGWLHADEEEDEDDLFGDDDLGFDDIDEDEIDEDDDDDLDEDDDADADADEDEEL
ncbi:MAG: hypothetical protein ACRDLP_17240 [Solirubrobacteraceae bacterium]